MSRPNSDTSLPSEIDVDALDAYLSSDASPEDCMQVSDLDGFLTAVAIGPELTMPSEWLSAIWRGQSPSFETNELAEFVTGQIIGRYNQILSSTAAGPDHIEPWFWQDQDGNAIAMDWCEGFFEGVELRAESWVKLLEDDHGKTLFAPIAAHLCDSDGNLMIQGDAGQVNAVLDEAAAMIPAAIFEISRFWKEHEQTAVYRRLPPHADVAESVDASDLKSLGSNCAGSSPAVRTSRF